ncbi:hypothetical protein ARZXY2_4119 [Arthrobacter sp. ZXY-2]|nr:hypothetical protein ARZXY2_4119 [Arthrobacter sp. ZXY-2]
MKSINAMWGGILTRLALDPVIQTCELRVEVVEAEGVSGSSRFVVNVLP